MPPEESRVANLPGVCVCLDDGDLALSPLSSATCFTPPAGLSPLIDIEWVVLMSSFSSVLGGIHEDNTSHLIGRVSNVLIPCLQLLVLSEPN